MITLERLQDKFIRVINGNSNKYYKIIILFQQANLISFHMYRFMIENPSIHDISDSSNYLREMIIKLFRRIRDIPNIIEIVTGIMHNI